MRNPLSGLIGLVALLMVHATLYPYGFSGRHTGFLNWAASASRGQWLDLFLNFYFFLPLGVLAGMRFREKQGMLASVLGASLLSLGVELAQAYIPGRYSSLQDVFLNSLGAACGILVAHLPVFDRELIHKRLEQVIEERGVLLLGLLWLCLRFFPFVPVLRVVILRSVVEAGLEGDWFDYRFGEVATINALMIFLVRNSYGRKAGLVFSGIVFVLSPIEIFVWAREASLISVVWGMIGAVVAAGFVVGETVPGNRVIALVSVGLMAYRELEPFSWEPMATRNFGWLPFAASFEVSRDAALRTLATKSFIYWHTLRQLCLGWGWNRWKVAISMSGVMLVAEWGQRYQPGRTPEITDSVLCLIGGLAGLGLVKAYSEQPDNR